MNCDRCHEPIEEETSWKAIIDGHGRVDVCDRCHVEYGKLGALSKTLLRYVLRDWFEIEQGDSIPEFDAQRHRILSLAAGRMYGLIVALTETPDIEGVIDTKRKMYELCGEIREALEEPSNTRDWHTVTGSKVTKEQALRMLEKLPADTKTVQSNSHPSTLATAINLNATLILLLGAILKQTIEGFPEDDKPCAHGQE
jgi:hypothetical protein